MKYSLLVALLIGHLSLKAQVCPQWIKNLGSCNGNESVQSSAMDDAVNIYVFGSFTNTFFGNVIFERVEGSQDLFIAKYSVINNLIWIKRVGGSEYNSAFKKKETQINTVLNLKK